MNDQCKLEAIQTLLGVEPDGRWGPKSQAALNELTQDEVNSGKGSWYSWYEGQFSWKDSGDARNSNALGVPDDQQGIALPPRSSLGLWFAVTAPNGKTLDLQQTDLGPAVWTGRRIDIAAVAAERFGYSPKNFPTNGIFSWKQIPPPPETPRP